MAERNNSGRKAIPLELLDNSSSRKTKKELKELKDNQFTTSSAKLTLPEDLSPIAKEEWKRIIRLYDGANAKILTDLDVQALRIYCEHTALYNKAASAMGQLPSILAGTRESQQLINQITKTMNDSSKIILAFSEQLCLTPVGRAKMGYASVKGSKRQSAEETTESKKAVRGMSDFLANRRPLI